jgi:DNA-binding transcriptional MerR regulator
MEQYTIGKVSKISHISIKTLRYYDEIGLLKPAYVSEKNGYRYYTKLEIQKIALIKYYKELGFKLDNIKELIVHYELNTLDDYFEKELVRLQQEIEETKRKYFTIKEWQNIIQQGRAVQRQLTSEQFEIKTMPQYDTVHYHYEYEEELLTEVESAYSNAFVKFCQQNDYYTFGAFIVRYPCIDNRIAGKATSVDCYSTVYEVEKVDVHHRVILGNIKVLTYLHKGPFASLPYVYEQIRTWAKRQNLQLADYSYERYVVDGWSTQNTDEYVTEILLPIVEE